MVWWSILAVFYREMIKCNLHDQLARSERHSLERKMYYCLLHMTLPGFTFAMAAIACFLDALCDGRHAHAV